MFAFSPITFAFGVRSFGQRLIDIPTSAFKRFDAAFVQRGAL